MAPRHRLSTLRDDPREAEYAQTLEYPLITLAFQFTLLGTFITRSGIITSVHAFAQSDIGGYFLVSFSLQLPGVIGTHHLSLEPA